MQVPAQLACQRHRMSLSYRTRPSAATRILSPLLHRNLVSVTSTIEILACTYRRYEIWWWEPDNMPCIASKVIDIMRKGVKEVNPLIIMELLLKKLAQMLWPKARPRSIIRARMIESFRVTIMAFLARLVFPAPNSFDTLVLSYIKCELSLIKFLKQTVEWNQRTHMQLF